MGPAASGRPAGPGPRRAPRPAAAPAGQGARGRARGGARARASAAALEGLDYRPELSGAQRAGTAAAGVLAGAVAYAWARRAPVLGAVCALVAAPLASVGAQTFLLERCHRRALRRAEEVADLDSEFGAFSGVTAHYKTCGAGGSGAGGGEAAAGVARRYALHFWHGFGANTFSWARVMPRLAEVLGAVCSAHDAPGFGLTVRPASVEAYTLENNGEVGLGVLDAVARRAGGAPKRVLVGHSMGGLTAAKMAAKHPEACAGLVLVDPAIVAANGASRGFRRAVARAAFRAAFLLVYPLTLLLRPFLLIPVRGLVRSLRFWYNGLGFAYADQGKVDRVLVDNYRRAKTVIDWDVGLLQFVLAQFKAAAEDAGEEDLVPRLDRAAREHGIPILILHGAEDRIVPVSNSRALARALDCELAVFPTCGHQPQEELPEEFAGAVADWLRRRV